MPKQHAIVSITRDDTITLEMPRDAAETLMHLVSSVVGCPERTYRKHTDAIARALSDLGFKFPTVSRFTSSGTARPLCY
jgi:hypothetical protein